MAFLRNARCRAVVSIVLACSPSVLCASSAWALINPNYTPVDLVNQTSAILRMEVSATDQGKLKIDGLQALKGDAPKRLALEVNRTDPAAVKQLREALDGGVKAALLFLGDFSEARADTAPGGGDESTVGVMYIDLTWFGLKRDGDRLLLESDQLAMKTVWAGSNAMLEKVIDYVQHDYRAELPVKVGVTWAGDLKLADLPGKVNACLAVELFEPGKPCLLILSESGDRLFQSGDDGKFDDITSTTALETRSRCAVCGDFNGDGRLDLVCTDGRRVSLLLMTESGKFAPRPVDAEFSGDCVGLTAIGRAGNKTGILVSTSAATFWLTPDAGKWTVAQLAGSSSSELEPETSTLRPCLAADFDGDGTCDVVRPHGTGAWFYSGSADGFAAATPACEAALGESTGPPFVGDFDADGLLDIVVPRKSCCSLLVNLGGGRFRDVLREAGEVDYNSSQSETIAGNCCDLNNDGRQDFVLFSPNVGFQPYFNRGFRCFGYAPEIDTQNTQLDAARAAHQGQQAGVVADFNGDGGQDIALVTADGEVWILWRDVSKGKNLSLSVSSPTARHGPINVIGFDGTRCLGAQPVAAGTPGFFCRRTKGPVKLRWQIEPGKKLDGQSIVLRPTQFRLPE